MNKYWYGSSNDGNVRFAHNESSLKEQGINNPQSFTASDVQGLNLIDQEQQVGGTQSSPQTTA